MDEKSIFVFCSKHQKTNKEALIVDMNDLKELIAVPISIESLKARRLVQKLGFHQTIDILNIRNIKE